MITPIATLTFPQHDVYISLTALGIIHVFKSDDQSCQWEIFDDYIAAADWWMIPPPVMAYCVVVPGDDQE